MRRPDWFVGVPPETVAIQCEGAEHKLTWVDGRLVPRDHDFEIERTLVALGGDPPACWQAVQAWEWLVEAARASARYSRSAVSHWDLLELMGHPSPSRVSLFSHVASAAQLQRGLAKIGLRVKGPIAQQIQTAHMRARSMHAVSSFPEPLRRLLAYDLIVASERRWWVDHTAQDVWSPLMETMLRDRVLPALRASLDWSGRRLGARTHVACWAVPPDEYASVHVRVQDGRSTAVAMLPLSWISRVYARGMAVVDGCFVVDVLEADDAANFRVLATRWQRRSGAASAESGEALVGRNGSGWSMKSFDA